MTIRNVLVNVGRPRYLGGGRFFSSSTDDTQTMITCWHSAIIDQEEKERRKEKKNSISFTMWTITVMVAMTRAIFVELYMTPTLLESKKKCVFFSFLFI